MLLCRFGYTFTLLGTLLKAAFRRKVSSWHAKECKGFCGEKAKVCGDQAGLRQQSISLVGLKLLLPPQRQDEWEERSRGV